MLYLSIMTHIEGRKDDALLHEKGGRGFPYLVFMDESGDVVAQQGVRSVEAFEKTGGDVAKFVDLRAKAATNDPVAVVDFALIEGKLGRAEFADVEKRIAGKELSAEQKSLLGYLRSVDTLMGAVKIVNEGGRGNEEAMKKAGAIVLELHQAGFQPQGRHRQAFWHIMFQYGMLTEKPDVAQVGFDGLKQMHGNNPRAATWLDQLQARIDEMKAAAEAPKPKKEEDGTEVGDG